MSTVEDKLKMNPDDEKQVIKEYNDILAKTKQTNAEANTLSETNAANIEKKLRDLLCEVNTFEPSKEVEGEKIDSLKKQLEEEKRNINSNISNCLIKQKKFDDAIKNEKRLMKSDKGNTVPYKRILSWYIESRKMDDATKFAEEIKKQFNGNEKKLEEFKSLFDKMEKIKTNASSFLEEDKKPAVAQQKDSKMEYVWMFLLAIILRIVIKYFKSKWRGKKEVPPTNPNPTKP